MKHTKNKGFTLIELLIVIVIIAVLAAAAFVALDPATRFADSRDAARWTDVTAVLEATKVDQVDNGGSYLTEIEALTAGTNYLIGTATGVACDLAAAADCDVSITAGDCVDLTGLSTEGYLAEVPVSPVGASTTAWDGAMTGYYMTVNSNGSVTVGACESENTADISVAR